MQQVTSIILAAGFSSRMGIDKALIKINDMTVVDMIIKKLLPYSEKIIVTTGINHNSLKKHLLCSKNVQLVHNHSPERGMFSSLKLAMQFFNTPFALIHLIDQPFILPNTYQNLISALDDQHLVFKPAFASAKRSGHPILISAEVAKLIKQASPEDNLRNIFHSLPFESIKLVPVTDQHVLDNINTKKELNKILTQEVTNAE